MEIGDINQRMRRLYYAINRLTDFFLNDKLHIQNFSNERYKHFKVSFDKNDDPEVLERVLNVIEHISKLIYHLERKKPILVNNCVAESLPLQLAIDIANYEKHGGHSRKQRSGKSPMLKNIKTVMQFITPGKKGSGVGMIFDEHGNPVKLGNGQIYPVISGGVVDKDGKILCSIDTLINESLVELEKMIAVE